MNDLIEIDDIPVLMEAVEKNPITTCEKNLIFDIIKMRQDYLDLIEDHCSNINKRISVIKKENENMTNAISKYEEGKNVLSKLLKTGDEKIDKEIDEKLKEYKLSIQILRKELEDNEKLRKKLLSLN